MDVMGAHKGVILSLGDDEMVVTTNGSSFFFQDYRVTSVTAKEPDQILSTLQGGYEAHVIRTKQEYDVNICLKCKTIKYTKEKINPYDVLLDGTDSEELLKQLYKKQREEEAKLKEGNRK